MPPMSPDQFIAASAVVGSELPAWFHDSIDTLSDAANLKRSIDDMVADLNRRSDISFIQARREKSKRNHRPTKNHR